MDSSRVQQMADEVAALMASRLGGLRRGRRADLATMLRRRGAALPRKLRAQALRLAEAEAMAAAPPRIARQADGRPAEAAHAALTKHLKPLGRLSRLTDSTLHIAASIAFGLLVLGAVVLWVLVWRGYL